VQIFVFALFEEKLNKLLDPLTLARFPAGYPVSGLTGYRAGQSYIRPDIENAGLSGRPDIRCIPYYYDIIYL
jgi:hypothetical protein